MRISDWSSDVCSSDLQRLEQQRRIDAAIQRDVAHRQRADGFAVVAVAQRDEARAPRLVAAVAEPVEGHLQRHLDAGRAVVGVEHLRSEEHTSELKSLIRISYAVFCLKKKKSHT